MRRRTWTAPPDRDRFRRLRPNERQRPHGLATSRTPGRLREDRPRHRRGTRIPRPDRVRDPRVRRGAAPPGQPRPRDRAREPRAPAQGLQHDQASDRARTVREPARSDQHLLRTRSRGGLRDADARGVRTTAGRTRSRAHAAADLRGRRRRQVPSRGSGEVVPGPALGRARLLFEIPPGTDDPAVEQGDSFQMLEVRNPGLCRSFDELFGMLFTSAST